MTRLFLMGLPNAGKTSLFNFLVQAQEPAGNYPGVTVEKKEGLWALPGCDVPWTIVDLPGIYGFVPHSLDEAVALQAWSERSPGDVVVAVIDATQWQRSLPFLLGLISQAQGRLIAVVNRWEGSLESEKFFQEALGIPLLWDKPSKTRLVFQEAFVQTVQKIALAPPFKPEQLAPWQENFEALRERFRRAEALFKRSLTAVSLPSSQRLWTDRIDAWVLHPVWGSLTLLVLFVVFFQAIFLGAEPIKNFLETLFFQAAAWVSVQQAWPAPLKSLLAQGLLPGVGSVLLFLPQILILFFFIFLLEDSGYFARAAFLMDRWMGKIGLHGRAFLPLLSSFACAVPGILSTRTLPRFQDRLITILVVPLMTCSARLPVYTLIIGTFIPNRVYVKGLVSLRGMVLLGLYALGLLVGALMARLFQKMFSPATQTLSIPFLMELPPYQWPSPKSLFKRLKQRALEFLQRVGTWILLFTFLFWILASYPGDHLAESWLGQIGQAIAPLFAPLGFSWEITVAVLSSFLAREMVIGALATVYSLETPLGAHLIQEWTLPTALSVLVWYVFSMQCFSTLAAVKKETQTWKWPLIVWGYLSFLAYVASWLTYRVASWIGGTG